MQNIAIIKQGTGRFLFSVPENVTLHEGDHVKCDTRRGITDGIAFADSAWVDENVSQLIGKLMGAKFPLKPVVGKMEYQPFEKPQDKPTANPANKYEGMSNKELDFEMCVKKGACSAIRSSHRKNDCPLRGMESCDITNANRAKVIKYLLAEDAEAAPKPEDNPSEDNPSEDKPEPIKLYCVEDCISAISGDAVLVKGTVYTFNPAAGALEFPDGRRVGDATEPRSYDDWKAENPCRAECLVPLVARPAKVGEWVLLDCDDCFHINNQGDVVEVVKAYGSNYFIKDPTGRLPSGICTFFGSEYSYVLDGYHPAPEPEKEPKPEYYNGKVVCVSSGDECFTVGKMYEFVNGKVKDDEGDERPVRYDKQFESVEEWNDECGMPIARFVEFKGEAHD